jgi:type I restriction enzyme S subunit
MTDLVIPSLVIVNLFGDFTSPIYQKNEANEDENYTPIALRDTLLPKLLSGEIRVKDAEKAVEASV